MARIKRVDHKDSSVRQAGISKATRSGRVRKKTATAGTRLPNMKADEEDSLIILVLQFWNVLEAKGQDVATNTQRNNAWDSIHEQYNASNVIVCIFLPLISFFSFENFYISLLFYFYLNSLAISSRFEISYQK